MALGHATCLPSPSPLFYFPASFPQLKPTVLPPLSKRHLFPRRLKSLSICVCVLEADCYHCFFSSGLELRNVGDIWQGQEAAI